MELKNTRLIRTCKAYLTLKNRETALKKREEQINAIVKSIVLDKSANEIIKMLQEVTEKINDKLDDKLKESVEAVEAINKHRKIKK